jgi:hypothetical protein
LDPAFSQNKGASTNLQINQNLSGEEDEASNKSKE